MSQWWTSVLYHILLDNCWDCLTEQVNNTLSNISSGKCTKTDSDISLAFLTFTPLTAAHQSLPRNLAMWNSWIREPPDRMESDLLPQRFWWTVRGVLKRVRGIWLVCKSDSRTHSMVMETVAMETKVCASVVLIFGRPSDVSHDECVGPNSRSGPND